MVQQGRLVVEPGHPVRIGGGQFLERFGRRRPLGLLQHRAYRAALGVSQDLISGQINATHSSEASKSPAVAFHQIQYGSQSVLVPAASFAAGEKKARRQAFKVPLPRAADGLVEVVEVEDEVSIGRGIGAEVADMGVAAKLHVQTRHRRSRQVRRHQRSGAAKKGESRGCHAPPLFRQKFGHPAGIGCLQEGHRIGAVRRRDP